MAQDMKVTSTMGLPMDMVLYIIKMEMSTSENLRTIYQMDTASSSTLMEIDTKALGLMTISTARARKS
jgi:hypothetical protein